VEHVGLLSWGPLDRLIISGRARKGARGYALWANSAIVMPAIPKETTLERLSGEMRATPTERTANAKANTAGHTSSWSLVIQFGMIPT